MLRFRSIVVFLFRWLGVIRLWRFWHRRDVIIVSMHGVMPAENPSSWEPLRHRLLAEKLDVYLRALSKHYNFVSLSAAVEMLTGQMPMQPYSLVVTFDDGYRNNLTHAMPVIRRHGAPATIFVATGHVEHRRPFWFDRLDYAIQHAAGAVSEIRIKGLTVRLKSRARPDLARAYKRLRVAAKSGDGDDGDLRDQLRSIAESLEEGAPRRIADVFEDDDWVSVATWNEIREAGDRADDVRIGSHTVDHVRLALVDDQTAREELAESKRMIEARTGGPCEHLSYPNGSYNRRVAELARQCGYTCAVTTVEGTNKAGEDMMTLRRVGIPVDASEAELLVRVCGLSAAMARVKNRIRRLLRG